MNTRKNIVCGVFAVILALTFAACSDGGGGGSGGGGGDGSNTAVTFSSVSANGSSSQTTTQLTLTFSQAISGLTAGDITLSGVSGVSKGTLSGSGPTYTLPISGFTSGGTLSVSVSKSGYDISGSPKSTTIYYYGSGGGGNTAVTFSSVSANGSSSQTTTQLTLTFSQAISGLTAGDITLSGVSGVSKGSLSGTGPTYTLSISGFTSGGTLSVAVSKSGYDISGSPKSTAIYYYSGSGPGPVTSGMLTINNFPSGSSLGVNVYDYSGEIFSMSDIVSAQSDVQKILAASVGTSSTSPIRLVRFPSATTFTGSGTYLVLLANASTSQTWYAQQVTFTNGSAEIDFSTMGLVSELPMTLP